MIRRYNFRLYPTEEQQKFFAVQFGCYRWVYNYFLERRRDAYDNRGEKLRYVACCRELTALKRTEEYSWLRDASEEALQGAIRAVDKSFAKFFKLKARYPVFKSKKGRQSFTGAAHYISFTGKGVKLPKAGLVRCKVTRDLTNCRPLSYTVIKDVSGKWTLSVAFDIQVVVKPPVIPVSGLGLDYSSGYLFIDSQGNQGKSQSFDAQLKHRIGREQRKLTRMQQGGKNYEKQRQKIGKYICKLVNTRNNYLHNLSTSLANSYDFISVEDLNMQELISTAGPLHIVRSATDNSYGRFVRMLDYKLEERGKKLVKVDKYFPSSQLCGVCGYKNTALTLDDREWTCPVCGAFHDRDVNAAINILQEGFNIIQRQQLSR